MPRSLKRVVRFSVLGSTQDTAKRLAEAGAPDRTLVTASRQTRGRGREDRRWSSGSGGVYFSLILRPRLSPRGLAALSLACGRALAKSLRAFGAETRVKPPNDILANDRGEWKKLAGILIEARSSGRGVDWLVIGVGINVNNRLPPGLGAAGLKSLTGKSCTPASVRNAAVSALLTVRM